MGWGTSTGSSSADLLRGALAGHRFLRHAQCVAGRKQACPLYEFVTRANLNGRVSNPCRQSATGFVIVLGLLLFPGPSRADISVSLPLDGFYRPGRYMPVRLSRSGSSCSAAIKLEARGAVPTQLELRNATPVIVPLLIVSDTSPALHITADLSGAPPDLPLRALNDAQRLVALGGESMETARTLFPRQTIVPIELDLSDSLLQPAQAWESLDAVILSEAAAARLTDQQIEILAGAGVLLAVHASQPPDHRWPWRETSGFWVLRYDPAGPRSALEPVAYLPTYSWVRGSPSSFRGTIVFIAVLFSILSSVVTLWRSKWAVALFLGLCAAAVTGIAGWYSRQSPMRKLSGGVVVLTPAITQYDLWNWRSPIRVAHDSLPMAGLTRPALDSIRQIDDSKLSLQCRPNGQPFAFDFELNRDQSLAFVTRSLQPDHPRLSVRPAKGFPMDFAEALYSRPGDSVVGATDAIGPVMGQQTILAVIERPR